MSIDERQHGNQDSEPGRAVIPVEVFQQFYAAGGIITLQDWADMDPESRGNAIQARTYFDVEMLTVNINGYHDPESINKIRDALDLFYKGEEALDEMVERKLSGK